MIVYVPKCAKEVAELCELSYYAPRNGNSGGDVPLRRSAGPELPESAAEAGNEASAGYAYQRTTWGVSACAGGAR